MDIIDELERQMFIESDLIDDSYDGSLADYIERNTLDEPEVEICFVCGGDKTLPVLDEGLGIAGDAKCPNCNGTGVVPVEAK